MGRGQRVLGGPPGPCRALADPKCHCAKAEKSHGTKWRGFGLSHRMCDTSDDCPTLRRTGPNAWGISKALVDTHTGDSPASQLPEPRITAASHPARCTGGDSIGFIQNVSKSHFPHWKIQNSSSNCSGNRAGSHCPPVSPDASSHSHGGTASTDGYANLVLISKCQIRREM